MIHGKEKDTLKISFGKVDGKVVQILRDTGFFCLRVNKNLV